MSDLKAYLASKYVPPPAHLSPSREANWCRYMSGPKADAIIARSGDPTIKKKKKKISKNEDYVTKLESGQGLMMRDEDEWKHGDGEDVDMNGDEDAPCELPPSNVSGLIGDEADQRVVVGKELATFNKSKSTWSTVGSTSLPMASQPSAAGPSSRSQEPEEAEQDTKPDIDHATGVKKVVTKRKGGLKTAAQIREDFEAVQAEKARALAEAEAAAEAQARENGEAGPSTSSAVAVNPHQGQTIHRDSSGRIVDVEKLKREAKAQEDEEKRKAREREEWSKGLVQRQKQQDRAREEAEMGSKDVARYVPCLFLLFPLSLYSSTSSSSLGRVTASNFGSKN